MPSVAYPATLSDQEVSSGLSVHQGVQSASCLRVTGSRNGVSVIWPRDGAGGRSGLELAHAPYVGSYIQSYDREHSAWLDMQLVARNILLAPQSGGKVSLPAGTAQATYTNRIIQAWNIPAVGTWYESPSAVTATVTAGNTFRVEGAGSVLHAAASAVVYIGVGVDGVLQLDSIQACQSVAVNHIVPYGFTVYLGSQVATSGSHRFAVFLYSNAAGAAGFWNGAYQYIAVTEQKA